MPEPEEKLPIERSVTINYVNNGAPFCKLTDLDNGRIQFTFYKKEKETYIASMSLTSLMSMLISLWPDEIACQFKDEDGN